MKTVLIKRQYFLYLIVLSIFLSGCGKQQKKMEQIKKIEDVSVKANELSTKAVNDTAFNTSEEYNSEMDNFNKALINKTIAMDQNDRLLVFFESSLRMLKKYSDKVKQNPSLAKDKNYMQVTVQWGSKVQEYNQALQKAKLTPEQKKKYDELNSDFTKL